MRCAVFHCDVCGAVSMLAGTVAIKAYMPGQADGEPGGREPLGGCCLVRDTEKGEETCEGIVRFRGYVYVAEPVH